MTVVALGDEFGRLSIVTRETLSTDGEVSSELVEKYGKINSSL